jgi:hypothetical protein
MMRRIGDVAISKEDEPTISIVRFTTFLVVSDKPMPPAIDSSG